MVESILYTDTLFGTFEKKKNVERDNESKLIVFPFVTVVPAKRRRRPTTDTYSGTK